MTATLNIEAGNLPTWADQQAERLAKLRTFQPKGWTAVGFARATKTLNNALRAAGLPQSFRETVVWDIIDLARLKAAVNLGVVNHPPRKPSRLISGSNG